MSFLDSLNDFKENLVNQADSFNNIAQEQAQSYIEKIQSKVAAYNSMIEGVGTAGLALGGAVRGAQKVLANYRAKIAKASENAQNQTSNARQQAGDQLDRGTQNLEEVGQRAPNTNPQQSNPDPAPGTQNTNEMSQGEPGAQEDANTTPDLADASNSTAPANIDAGEQASQQALAQEPAEGEGLTDFLNTAGSRTGTIFSQESLSTPLESMRGLIENPTDLILTDERMASGLNLARNATGTMENTLEAGRTATNGVLDGAEGAINSTIQSAATTADNALNTTSQVLGRVGNTVEGAINSAVSGTQQAVAATGDVLTQGIQGAQRAVNVGVDALTNTVSTLGTGAATGTGTGGLISTISDTATTIGTSILGETGMAIGGAVLESLPVIGELAGVGMLIYGAIEDLFGHHHSAPPPPDIVASSGYDPSALTQKSSVPGLV